MRSAVFRAGRGPHRLLAALLLAAASAVAATPAQAQGVPAAEEWWTLHTEHFRVTFQPDLEPLARRAADAAERVHAALSAELTEPPAGTIDILLTDHLDVTNGFATPFPSNRITLYARPPLGQDGLAYTRDWIETVVAHELVHTFHMDRTGRVGRALRGVFGRVPMVWPLFPAVGTPAWNVEGLATHYESRLTGAGRVHGTFHRMVVRTAALESRIPDLDQVSTPSPVWPGGHRTYVYGASFMRWLADTYGPDVHERLIDATAGSILPTFLFFDQVAEEATGRDFDALFSAWREEAVAEAQATRDALAGTLTPTTPLPGTEADAPTGAPYAVWPRVSPDGGAVAYSSDDFRSHPSTRLLDLGTGTRTTLARRNQTGGTLGPPSWLPDGSGVVVAQLEFRDPWNLWSDLWRVGLDGSETRLTDGARLERPDVAPDGRRIVAVQNRDGALPLVIHDLERGTTTALADARPGEGFGAPRWSPDGRTVAAARFLDGRMDLVLVDVATGRVTPLTDDDALDMGAAWSPDGRWLLFWSDRSGIANLHAIDVAARPGTGLPPVLQVTSVLGGAFDPDISPDGRWIYFSAYHHDGWRIERIPFDTASWRPAAPAVIAHRDGLLEPMEVGWDGAPEPAAGEDPPRLTRYTPWETLRPRYWVPAYLTAGAASDRLDILGVAISGHDLLQRHVWRLLGGADLGTGRLYAEGAWLWRGLGTPELTFGAGRTWEGAGTVFLEGGGAEGLWFREDYLYLDALLLRRRWRGSAWLTGGAELLHRRYELHRGGDEGEAILDELDLEGLPTLLGTQIGAGWSSASTFPYSISLQDGFTLSGAVSRWWEVDGIDRSYDQLHGRLAGYRGFRRWGFADHVVAGRLSAVTRVGDDAVPTSIGGVGGAPASLGGGIGSFGGVGRFLPVRGYDDGDRRGTRAWSASAEYRYPIHLAGHGGRLLGLSITAVSGAFFADAGNAWCADPFPGCPTSAPDPLLSAGAELSVDLGVLHTVPLRFRGGVAVPFTDLEPDDDRASWHPRGWRFHLVVGPSF